MNPILIALSVIVPLFKDTFKNMFKSKESKIILIAVVGYWLYTRLKTNETATAIDASLGTDPTADDTVRMFNALHPTFETKLPILGYLPDGTDETAVQQIGTRQGQLKAWDKLSNYYKIKYGTDLASDLQNEGVYDSFWNAYNNASGTTTGTTTTPKTTTPKTTTPVVTGATVKNAKNISIIVGSSYFANAGWNYRDNTSPFTALGQTTQGQVWNINSLIKLTINGKQTQMAKVSKMGVGYIPYLTERIIAIDAFYAKF